MSADNGIYIHKFPDGWKVCHGQAVDNIYYEPDESGYNQTELKRFFANSPLYESEDAAREAAWRLYEKYDGMLEYGVCVV